MNRFLAIVLLALTIAAPASAQNTARMEQIVQDYVANKAFMGTVLVVKDDHILLDKAYGFANLEWNIPNTTATKFRLGSLTKQFTAVSILLLEERNKLKLDDPVKKYFPDAPAAWDKITIFNLLNHTSGIPNMTAFDNFKEVMRKTMTPADLVAGFRDRPLDFQPGEKYSYSNSGYIVLGVIIEKASGVSYAQFLQDNIFAPLGMKASGYDSNSALIPLRASGYGRRQEGLVNADFIDMSIPYSAGSLYSTTHDLWTWEKALYSGKLISPASLKKMTASFKDNYGFGLFIRDEKGRKQFWHNGSINGFATALAWYPDHRLAIVALSNIAPGAATQMLSQLADVVFGRPVLLASERKEVSADPKVLARYIGRYELRPDFVMEISQEGDHLFAQATKQSKIPLFAESEKTFFSRVVDAQITFEVNNDGPAAALLLHQGGRDIRAKRLP